MNDCNCPSCGSKNPISNRHCGNCGSSLAKASECQHCNHVNPEEYRHCGKCGKPLSQNELERSIPDLQQNNDNSPTPGQKSSSARGQKPEMEDIGVKPDSHSMSKRAVRSSKARYKPINIFFFLCLVSSLYFWVTSGKRNLSNETLMTPLMEFSIWLATVAFASLFVLIRLWWGDNAQRMSRARNMGDWFWSGVLLGSLPSVLLLFVRRSSDSTTTWVKPVKIGGLFAISGILSGLVGYVGADDLVSQKPPADLFGLWLVGTCGLTIAISLKMCWGDIARRMSRDRGMGDWFWLGIIFGPWVSLFLEMFHPTKTSTPVSRDAAMPDYQKAMLGGRKCAACGCLLSPVMTSCPRCKADTPLDMGMVVCSRCKEAFPREEGACPVCSEGLGY